VNPIETMPKEGEFWARHVGIRRSKWVHCVHLDDLWVTSLVGGDIYGRAAFDAWLPIPTANHRLVTVEDLEELVRLTITAERSLSYDPELMRALDTARTKVGLL
jgi:hypothetical protein